MCRVHIQWCFLSSSWTSRYCFKQNGAGRCLWKCCWDWKVTSMDYNILESTRLQAESPEWLVSRLVKLVLSAIAVSISEKYGPTKNKCYTEEIITSRITKLRFYFIYIFYSVLWLKSISLHSKRVNLIFFIWVQVYAIEMIHINKLVIVSTIRYYPLFGFLWTVDNARDVLLHRLYIN